MNIPVSENLNRLAEACPFPLYLVGGTVRDSLAGLRSADGDYDICAPASAESFVAAAEKCGARICSVYKNTGTVKLSVGGEEYEYACFRSDEYVRGVHSPVKTFFTDDIMLDARRRDFKCNAVYLNLKTGETEDPLGGAEDIKHKRITTVADADKVFGEDGLRLMRLARQAAQTGFTPDGQTLDGALKNARLISDVSAERIYTEFNYILMADLRYGIEYAQYAGLKILDETGVADLLFPEITAGRGMAQNAAFHNHDVYEHTLRAVKYADPTVRLAAFLHDAGKPQCMRENGNYINHEEYSARIARDICTRLKVPKKTSAETVTLCALHMYDMRCDARESKIRRFIVRNLSVFDKLLLLKQADYSACRDDLSTAPCVEKWRGIYNAMSDEGAPLNLKQLKVRGDELIAAGVPAPQAGAILNALLEECALNPELNVKEKLVRCALSLCAQGKY